MTNFLAGHHTPSGYIGTLSTGKKIRFPSVFGYFRYILKDGTANPKMIQDFYFSEEQTERRRLHRMACRARRSLRGKV